MRVSDNEQGMGYFLPLYYDCLQQRSPFCTVRRTSLPSSLLSVPFYMQQCRLQTFDQASIG